MTDSNLTPQEQYNHILDRSSYTFTHSQYQELEVIAARYESLNSLLQPFSDDKPLSSVSCLFDSLNESFFEFMANIAINQANDDEGRGLTDEDREG